MINNSLSPRSWALLASLLVPACAAKAAPPGYQGIVEYEERLLALEVSGRIERVPVKRGDVLKSGDLIAEVDATLERLARDARREDARVAEAELALLEAGSRKEDVAAVAAQLRAAEAGEALLEKSRERAAALRASQAISQAELDRAEADLARATNERASLLAKVTALRHGARAEELARARARTSAAAAALALAEARVDRFALRSTGEGSVLDVHVEPGELATPGMPIATVADRAHPFVEVFVPQGELAGITPGKKVSVKVDSDPAPLDGVVEHVAAQTEFTPKFLFSERERPNLVVRVRVRAFDPDNRLHAGVPAFVKIER